MQEPATVRMDASMAAATEPRVARVCASRPVLKTVLKPFLVILPLLWAPAPISAGVRTPAVGPVVLTGVDALIADGFKCELIVIGMRGWKRDMWFDQTHLTWVPTSPHIPHSHVAMFYAATGIMGELQVVSEGVGYTLPFELAGAPFITDAQAFAKALNDRKLPGVHFRPMYFKPY